MLFRQLLHERPVTAVSYLIGCAGHGVGAVIDPVLEADEYRRMADALGVRIALVIDTHVHADHISGGAADASWNTGTPSRSPSALSWSTAAGR